MGRAGATAARASTSGRADGLDYGLARASPPASAEATRPAAATQRLFDDDVRVPSPPPAVPAPAPAGAPAAAQRPVTVIDVDGMDDLPMPAFLTPAPPRSLPPLPAAVPAAPVAVPPKSAPAVPVASSLSLGTFSQDQLEFMDPTFDDLDDETLAAMDAPAVPAPAGRAVPAASQMLPVTYEATLQELTSNATAIADNLERDARQAESDGSPAAPLALSPTLQALLKRRCAQQLCRWRLRRVCSCPTDQRAPCRCGLPQARA